MIQYKKHILILIFALILFSNKINAQQVRVIDNKGTIQTVNNNLVTTSPTFPSNPVEGDIWFDTTNSLIRIFDPSLPLPITNQWPTITSTAASSNIYTTDGTLDANRFVNGGTNNLRFSNLGRFDIDNANYINLESTGFFDIKAISGINLRNSNTIVHENLSVKKSYIDSSGDVGTNGQILSSTATGTDWIDNAALSNWLTTGNTGTTAANFLGTIDDVKMQIRSNNLPILEFGRRGTLGLDQSYPDYTDVNQPLVYLRGNNNISALQFAASGASFYKPMFYTTSNGSFRLKGSSGATDLFEIGSAGPNNQGRLEFTIGDDGNEPITFKRYYYSPQIYREFFRVQGNTTGRNAKTRFGININQQEIPVTNDINANYNTGNFDIANSTLQIKGSVSKSILTTTNNLTLNEDHYSIIINGNHAITLPSASTCEGREYILKNITSNNINISNYRNLSNINANSIGSNTILKLQSNGSIWHQMNNSNTTSSGGGSSTLTYIDKYNNANSTIRVARYNTNGTLIPLNSVRLFNGPINNRNNNQVQITENGLYEVTYTVSLRKENGNDFSNGSNSLEVVVCENTNPITNTGSIVTLIGNNNQRYVSASRTVLLNLRAFQSYGVKIREESISNSGDVVIDANATGMTIRKIN